MKILVTGQGGQLAWELEQTTPNNVDLIALSQNQLDITDRDTVFEIIQEQKPDLIINAAAYTAVDKAETEPEVAFSVNAKGSENLALACKKYKANLIHISTDFVFDGTKTTPYTNSDRTCPINVYGESKLVGDQMVSKILGSQSVVIRTAWVYSANGNNFVKTMLNLMREKDELGIVYDQVGTPTWAKGLARMIWSLIQSHSFNDNVNDESLMLHWTDAGVASWYDFACSIQELALNKGLLKNAIPVRPISADAYPTPAKRPNFSVIDKSKSESISKYSTIHWRKQLSDMLDELKEFNPQT